MSFIVILLVNSAVLSCVVSHPPSENASSVVERALTTGGGRGSEQHSTDDAATEERRRALEECLGRRRDEIRDLAAPVLRDRSFSDVRELWMSSRQAAARGEFETNDEADQRREEFFARHFVLDLEDSPKGSGKTVALAREKRESEGRTARLRYDMDRRALLVRVVSGFSGSKIHRLKLFEETTSSMYEGRNAFGVSATVERMIGVSYAVDLRNLDTFVARENRIPIDEIREQWFVEAPIEPEFVRDRVNNIKVLAVVKVDQELGSWQEQLSEEPTFRIPLETSIQVHVTSCWLEALVVYDAEDRTILQVVVDPTPQRSGT